MDVQQLSVKVFATAGGGYDPESLIPVFHRWIRERLLPDRLLIDVADYRHVVDGPGVLVVGNECHFGVDAEGQLGLLYSRKRDPIGPADEKLREAFFDTLRICKALAGESSVALTLNLSEWEIRVMSRLVAENSEATMERFEPVVTAFISELFATESAKLAHLSDPKEPFGVRISVSEPPAIDALLARIEKRAS